MVYTKNGIFDTGGTLHMDGYQYEKRCAKFLQENGFRDITVTPGSGDQGIDITASKGGKKYGIQCKYYEGTVGNKAVQEAYAGAAYYGCEVAMVITNSTFSKSAAELALRLNVILQESVDAISLYQSSEQLTFEEKEALEVERIERLLQEKYRSLRLKFPKAKNNDDEISSYIKRAHLKMLSYKADDKQWLEHYTEEKRTEEQRRCPFFFSIDSTKEWEKDKKKRMKALEREPAERDKQENRRNKELLDQVNYDIGKFVAAGVSEASAKNLIALFWKVYSYAGSPDTVKYYRMKDKWKTLEESLPSIVEKRDKEAEKLAIQSVRKKLASVENEIRQLRTALEDEHAYNEKLTTLSDLQQELHKLKLEKNHMNCEDELAELKANYQNTQEQYQRNILELDTEIASKSDQIRQAQTALSQMSIFSFKKKDEKKDLILSLEKEKSSLETKKKDLIAASEGNTNSYQSSIEDIKMIFDSKKVAIEKKIKDLEKKIAQCKKDIEKNNPEKKQERLCELDKLLPTLRREAKNARKNYLLETYRAL